MACGKDVQVARQRRCRSSTIPADLISFMLARVTKLISASFRVRKPSPTHDKHTLAKLNRSKEQRTNTVRAWCVVRSSSRKKRAEHRGADDALSGARRAVAAATGRQVGRRRGDAGAEPGHGLSLRGETDVEAGRDKDGTAARADGGWDRRSGGHVELRVERHWGRAG